MSSINSPLDLFKWDYKNFIPGKHLEIIDKRLMKFINGDIENLALFIPPRHSKSMMASLYLPAYWMLIDPDVTIIQAGHSKNLVEQFVMNSRDIVSELSDYPLNPAMQRMNEYKYDRPHTGHVKGIGIGGGITGFGAKVLIMDDLIKGAEESMNPSARRKLDDYYSGTLSTRLMPGGQKLLIMTRWHNEDIASKILDDEEDSWEVLQFPALCQDETLPLEQELGRKDGEALWPEYWPIEELLKRKQSVGNYFWNAEYLCNPIPQDGNLLNPEGIQYYSRTPSTREYKTRILAVDLAISENARADETCATLIDVDAGGFYVEKQWAWRKGTDYTEKQLGQIYNMYKPDSFYMESIGFQKVVLTNLQKRGIPVMGFIDNRNKLVKIGELAPHIDNRRIHLKTPVNQWDELLNQLSAFPMAPHDDRLESLWMAVKFAETSGSPYSSWDGDPDFAYEFSPAGMGESRSGGSREKHRKKAMTPYSSSLSW